MTLYTYINHHVGTSKQKQTSYYTGILGPDYGTVIFYREIKLKIEFGVVISKEVSRS